MAKNSKDKTISIRLSQQMLEALDARAILDEKDRTQVIREAINKYLDLPEESVGEKIENLAKKHNSLDRKVNKLHGEVKSEVKRADSFEVRLEEMGRMIAAFLEKSK